MARARNIKPGLYKNEDLAECTVWARYIFPGLWMLADRDGRLEDRPKRIKGELLPYDTVDVDPLLEELAAKVDEAGKPLIRRYEVEGRRYIEIPSFKDHQNPHYSEKESVIPPPTFPESPSHEATGTPGGLREDSGKWPALKRGSQPPDSLIPDSLIPESRKEGARKRASRLPEDFKLTPEWEREALAITAADGLVIDVQREFAKFRDFWRAKAGKDGAKLDWLGTWRNWIRKACEFAKRDGAGRANANGTGAAETAWNEVVGAVRAGRKPDSWSDPLTDQALGAVGGWVSVRDMQDRDLPFRKRDFVAAHRQAGAH